MGNGSGEEPVGRPEPPSGQPAADPASLLRQRQAARERRDFATADAIRDQLRQAGWLVSDTPDGPELTEAPPYQTLDPAALAQRWDEPDRYDVSVVAHVAGWPEDVARATRSLAAHHRHLGYEVLLVSDGVGQATGRVLVWLDPHVEATGDLLGPLLAALDQPGTGLAGGWGVTTTTMLEFEADDGPEVDAIEGYLLAVPRALAARVRVDPKDRYYRNADLDYSFAVRALGSPGPLRAVRVEVPATRHRHRGFHEADPTERDRASRKNYDRFLGRWKGRTDLLTRGFRGYHRHR